MFEQLGFVPEGFHFGARGMGEGSALRAGDAFHFTEAAGKFGAGFFQRDFGVEVEEAREIDGDEEEIAKLGFDGGGRES